MSTEPQKKPSLFSIVTLLLGVVAIVLLALRISRAWNLQYGDGPREPPPPIPTGGSYGPPGIVPELPLRSAAPTASAPEAPSATPSQSAATSQSAAPSQSATTPQGTTTTP